MKMLVGLFVAPFGDYGEYERWNSNAHTSGFGVRLPQIGQVVKTGWAGLSTDSGDCSSYRAAASCQ